MNVKSFAVGLPGIAGALGTIIATILLIVGLVTDFEGSSGTGSSDRAGVIDAADSASTEKTSVSPKPKGNLAEKRKPKPSSTPVPEPGTKNAGATVSLDEDGNRVETWFEGIYEWKETFYPDGASEITRRELPGYNSKAALGEDADGNPTETWIEDGVKHVKTFLPNGKTRVVTSDAEPKGYSKIWSENGVRYEEKYDGYGNLIERTQTGTPTPPPPPAQPEDPRPWDASDRTNYTSADLEQEVNRQFTEWNKYRVAKGMKPGQWDEQFANEAQKWAEKLAAEDKGKSTFYNKYPHERDYVLSGIDPVYNASYVRLYGGENVWKTDSFNLETTLQQFIESPGHNGNLLTQEKSGDNLHMGIGIAKGPEGSDRSGRTPYYVVYKMR